MNEFRVSSFMEMVYEDVVERAGEPLEEVDNWKEYQRRKKEQIRDVLKLSLLKERYDVPLVWQKTEEQTENEYGVRIEKYRVEALRNLTMAVHVLHQEREGGLVGKTAVMFLNGHDPRGAEGAYRPLSAGGPALGMELARLGYVVLVPELFAFGEAKRREAPDDLGACESCAETEPWLLNCGLNLAGLRVWEALKTLDFAQEALGLEHFGVYGISGGGHICNYAGVLDDRIEAMMVSGYPNLYKYSTMAMVHCICNYVPGQIELGESHHITALAAPEKKLLVMNGREDPIFPKEGSRIAFAYLEEVYRRLGAPDNCTAVLFEGGHEISVPEVCRWLEENWPNGAYFF